MAYYVINNNMGYDGDLELALIPEDFRIAALNETLDDKKVLTGNETDAATYADWYKAVYMPTVTDAESETDQDGA